MIKYPPCIADITKDDNDITNYTDKILILTMIKLKLIDNIQLTKKIRIRFLA